MGKLCMSKFISALVTDFVAMMLKPNYKTIQKIKRQNLEKQELMYHSLELPKHQSYT